MGNRAVIYCRVSTARQAKEELPIESQVKACEKKAADLGLSAEKIFLDEGISATSDRRPGFQDAIAYCEVFKIDCFITWSSSRFARNKRDAAFYKDRLDACGTRVVYVSMDIDTSTTSGWMVDGFMELFDEYFSRQVSADTKRSMIRNAKDGYWNGGGCPYGYQPQPAPDNPKRRILSPVPDEADIINMIFRMKANRGMGARAIMTRLNNEEITRRGKPWKLQTLRDLLKNQAVIGKTVFGKTSLGKKRTQRPPGQWIIVNSHQPVVDESLFYKVQAILAEESQINMHTAKNHFLAGLVTCTECNTRMHIESASGRNRKYYYYFCPPAKYEKTHEYRRYRTDLIEDLVTGVVNEQVLSAGTLHDLAGELATIKSEWDQDSSKKINIMEKEISDLEKKNSNLIDVLQALGTNVQNLSDITKVIQENKERINQHQLRIRTMQSDTIPSMMLDIDIDGLRAVFEKILENREDIETLREFLHSFIQNIEINQDELLVNYEPLRMLSDAVHIHNGWLPGPDIMGTKSIRVIIPDKVPRRRRVA